MAHKVKNAAASTQRTHKLSKEEPYPGTANSQLPVIFLKDQVKYFDLGSSINKQSLTCLNDVQRLRTAISDQSSYLEDVTNNHNRFKDDIIESRVDPLRDGHTKSGSNTKLVNALLPQDLEWREQTLDLSKLPSYYARLSKSRLTGKNLFF